MRKYLRAFRHYLALSLAFTRQDLVERYAGTSFGQLWLLISPLITIFIYTIIFSDFMQMKLHIVNNAYSYSIYLVPGLLSWNFFASVVSRLSNAIHEKAPVLKKVSIPMYVYYISITLTELIYYGVAMVMGVAFVLLVGQPVTPAFLWLPVLMFFWMLFSMGLGVLFSLFTPFFRDLREIVPIVLQLWFWMTPIIYVKSMLMHKIPWLVTANPAYYFIEPFQEIFLYGRSPSLGTWATLLLLSGGVFGLAMWLYRKMIPTIKDML